MMDKKWLDCYAFFVLIIKAKPLSLINESLERERERERERDTWQKDKTQARSYISCT